jgi:hypothetical protein
VTGIDSADFAFKYGAFFWFVGFVAQKTSFVFRNWAGKYFHHSSVNAPFEFHAIDGASLVAFLYPPVDAAVVN